MKLAGWHLKEEIWELEEKVMAVAYSLWESHSTGVSLEAEKRTGWGTLPPQEFIRVEEVWMWGHHAKRTGAAHTSGPLSWGGIVDECRTGSGLGNAPFYWSSRTASSHAW